MRNTIILKWNKTHLLPSLEFKRRGKTRLALSILKAEQMQEKEQCDGT